MQARSAIGGPRTPGVLNTLHFGMSPEDFTRRNVGRYGRTFRIKSAIGPALFTTDGEHVKRIFAADASTFFPFAPASLTSIFGPRSVLLTGGAQHKHQRKLLTPPLHGQRLRAFGATMAELARETLAPLRVGDTVRVHDLTTRFTLDVIVRTVFGVELAEERAELRGLLEALVEGVPPSAIFVPGLQSRFFPPWARYLAARDRFDAWLARKIASRRASGGEHDDVLSLLLASRYDDGTAMSDAEIRDQLVTVLLAGHETTAIALASATQRLLRAPDVLAKLRAEVDGASPAPEDVQRLPYLSAVLDETLRIDPIVTDVVRVPKAPFELAPGSFAEAEELLVVLIEGIHRDPAIYPDPDRFRPERFLERKFGPHEFLPFGGGLRRCLGAAFSDYEGKLFLFELVRRLELAKVRAEPDRRVRRNITMGPARGVEVHVTSLRPCG